MRGLSGPVECVASPLGCAWPHGGGTRGLSGSGVRGPTQREGTWHLGWGARGNTGCGARGNPGPVGRVASPLGVAWPLCGEHVIRGPPGEFQALGPPGGTRREGPPGGGGGRPRCDLLRDSQLRAFHDHTAEGTPHILPPLSLDIHMHRNVPELHSEGSAVGSEQWPPPPALMTSRRSIWASPSSRRSRADHSRNDIYPHTMACHMPQRAARRDRSWCHRFNLSSLLSDQSALHELRQVRIMETRRV